MCGGFDLGLGVVNLCFGGCEFVFGGSLISVLRVIILVLEFKNRFLGVIDSFLVGYRSRLGGH